tara:strand:- start:1742 stop:1927 length:186 start_codon:yes stop_codon:yes gene_type:complete
MQDCVLLRVNEITTTGVKRVKLFYDSVSSLAAAKSIRSRNRAWAKASLTKRPFPVAIRHLE